jgi:hypothetical protein
LAGELNGDKKGNGEKNIAKGNGEKKDKSGK